MKQEIITGNHSGQFHKDVNEMLRIGWKVIPGTLVVAGAAGHNTNDYARNNVEWAFMVVLEKAE